MAESRVAPGKKRYYLTLTEKRFEAFKSILREIGAPRGFESVAVDDFIRGMVEHIGPVILKLKNEGREPSFGDFMMMFGSMMNETSDEQLKL